MCIVNFIKHIGRGKEGARPLQREQAADLLGQLLDGRLSELEIGAFCLAMRIKGETADEMAGFLDAIHARVQRLPATTRPLVLLPSYNGARKLPLLTPLLAWLLVRQGLCVVVHGEAEQPGRVTSTQVLHAQGVAPLQDLARLRTDWPNVCALAQLSPALQSLLDVRRVVGLRNPGHSLVKLMTPCHGPSVLVTSYTHPEYAQSMAATLRLMGTRALLLRGTEGEPVADARRTPQMDGFAHGQQSLMQAAQSGPLLALPDWPTSIDATATAAYTQAVLDGQRPVPAPVMRQVEHILQLAASA